ncbi:hydroxymethylpyrimidine/phosphomethylpyrimidine kinase [Campylobacter pinnipediorum]|uniref:hydroxymethylpyrimidine/phosphomethylpyrimidine kinase n=1 Tax=Campylobacter pinnipediorum TaxID=1965231 RepID=UPI00084DEDC3|nr:hydroxymethylpyrimidine/phosphomethylpyrimidine kinase [Campylobacter pinnipediorum]AQW82683.1 hydroxymethylpyrimidine kinase / phosphohydroxymethylpyrimidine kinase [Campylobacter pinnipediorum subsp. pinnipediorum]OPA77178.1 hydroxymethylpyrimidine/phosphomethylpyrimidine kinase [Campylobacter pinnipediorum subsp. pinnipediorum]
MKNILIIAGSDSVAGAGAQADIKTCGALGCYGAAAISVLVAENSQNVVSISEVSSEFVDSQIKCIVDELKIDAVKIGMLYNTNIINTVLRWIPFIDAPIVLDPVCISKSNIKLIDDDAIDSLKELFKYATIATPNKFEAECIFQNNFNNLLCDIVVKKDVVNGYSVDRLYKKDGGVFDFSTPLIKPELVHGAGCTFSSAIACFLALGFDIQDCVKNAKNYVYNAILNSHDTKFGKTLLRHNFKDFNE